MEIGLCLLILKLTLFFASSELVVAAPFEPIAIVLESRNSRFQDFALQNRALPTGTCNANTPCKSSNSPVTQLQCKVCRCFEYLLTSILSWKA